MKRNLLLLMGLIAIAMSSASGAAFEDTRAVYVKNPNRIFFGPAMLLLDFRTHIRCVEVEGHMVFGGLILGYERLKPEGVYFGIDLLSMAAGSDFDLRGGSCRGSCGCDLSGFGRIDLRLGYAFELKNGLLSPFLGVGFYSFQNEGHCYKFEQTTAYVSGGIRGEYGVTPSFDIGMRLGLFCEADAERKALCGKAKYDDERSRWGGEVAIPLTWHAGVERRWDVRFEPYMLGLDFTETQNLYGAQLLFGYRF